MDMDVEHGHGGMVVCSPWYDRQGDAATFNLEIIRVAGSGTLQVAIERKNKGYTSAQDTTNFFPIASSTIALHKKDLSDLKEQVRFKYTIGGSVVDDYVAFRMLEPVWREKGAF